MGVKGIVIRSSENLEVVWGNGDTWSAMSLINDIKSTNSKKWNHIAITYDYKNYSLTAYVNGDLVGTKIQQYKNSGHTFQVGYSVTLNPDISYWRGSVKDIRLYKKILSNRKIKKLSKTSEISYSPYEMAFSLNKGKTLVIYKIPLIPSIEVSN